MTKTTKHSILFRLWIHIRGILAVIIVLFGILVGLISLILPNEELYKDYVIKFLSQQWNKQVEIESISGKWKGFGPHFIINGLIIKDQDEVLVQQASLKVNVFQYLIPRGSTGISLGISDIEVDFEKNTSGEIVLSDEVINKQSFSDKLEKLLDTGTLSVQNLTLNLIDPINNIQQKIQSKITVQQNSDKRAFVLELDSKNLADSIIFKAITEKQYEFMQQAKWYIQTDNLSLKRVNNLINKNYFPTAYADVKIWADTQKGNITKMLAQADLKNKIFNNDAEITGQAELVYTGDKRNWAAQISIQDIKTTSISQDEINIHLSRQNNIIKLEADVLDISLLKTLSQLLNIANDDFYTLELNGKLSNVSIKYDTSLRRVIAADIRFNKLDLIHDIVKFNNISGEVGFHDEQIRLIVDSEKGKAEIPNIMRGEVNWENLILTAQSSMHGNDIDVKINSLWCDCIDFKLDGAARIAYDEELLLDLNFAVHDVQVNQLYKYWPANVWKPKLLNFLDQALVQGVVENGMILYHGFTNQYPFKAKEGVFSTKAKLQNATVNYQNDWPNLTKFNAVVDTINTGLTIQSNQGKVLDARINIVTANIEDFKKPYLNLTAHADGKDSFLIDILKQSPMNKGLQVLNEGIELKGQQKVKLNIGFPLNVANVKVIPKGSIDFIDTNFQLGQFQLNGLNGVLDFHSFSLKLKKLQARFLNRKVNVTGEIINLPEEYAKIDVLLKGHYNIDNFEQILGMSLPAQGDSEWLFSISNNNSKQINFKAQSDLFGVQLDMPEPFIKQKHSLIPFSINCTLPCIDSGWDMSLGEKITTNFTLNSKEDSFQLNKLMFGQSEYDFGGQLDVVDVDEWLSLLAKSKINNKSKNLPFEKIQLKVKKLIFMARELKDVDLEIVTSEQGIRFNIDAEDIKGTVKIADDLNHKGIIVKLNKLHWQAPDINKIKSSSSNINSNYPALHIWIGDFIYDGIPFGESSIEVRPISGGIRVEKMITHSNLLKLNINGTWHRNQGKNGTSNFNIIMTSKNIAKFLQRLGFQAPISQAETIIDMQAQWANFPSQFEIKNITGKMRIEIGQGEVVDAEPGIGRVLGLFSLTNLPRRLILDFRDVFGKGLHFKSMIGDFTLNNGDAYTESFEIDSSTAEITLSGKTGLASQDYDQIIIVVPQVGKILPTIGGIAGGAVGAAAGFLVQGVFYKGLKNVGKITYKVTGSWDEPIIKLVEPEEKNEK